MLPLLASGQWLDQNRIQRIAALSLLATIGILSFAFITSSGTVDLYGRPLGTDFSNVWTAGRMALEGHASEAWDWKQHYAVQQQAHAAAGVDFYGWHYPPPFLLIAAALATIDYVPALIVWQVATLALVLVTVRAILPGSTAMLVAVGAPVVLVCLTHGHNGFLTAALLGGGLSMLDRRPWLAGMILGCIVYKPQFALVLPVVLLVGGHWRAIGGASVSAAALCLATLALWGWPVWQAFLDSLPLTQSVVIEQGATGWEKIQSAFSAVRAWGVSVPVAWCVQGVVTAAAVIVTALTVRYRPAVRNAVVIAAALLSTPYMLDYDLVPLGIAIAFLVADGVQQGFRAYDKSLLAFVWITPLVARNLAMVTSIPLGLLSIVAVLVVAVRRGIRSEDVETVFRDSFLPPQASAMPSSSRAALSSQHATGSYRALPPSFARRAKDHAPAASAARCPVHSRTTAPDGAPFQVSLPLIRQEPCEAPAVRHQAALPLH